MGIKWINQVSTQAMGCNNNNVKVFEWFSVVPNRHLNFIQASTLQETVSMEKRLLNIRDASVYLGISVNTLRCWCSRRTIPYVKIGSMVRFDMSVLEQWIKEQTVNPDGPNLA